MNKKCALLSPTCGIVMTVLAIGAHLGLAWLQSPPLDTVELLAPVYFYLVIAHQCLFYGRRHAEKTLEAQQGSTIASALLRVAHDLAGAASSAALVQRLADDARDSVSAEWAAVLIRDSTRSTYRVVGIASRTGFIDEEITTIEFPASEFDRALTTEPGDCFEVHSPDDSFAPRWLHERWRFDRCLAAPLHRAGDPIGLLVIGPERDTTGDFSATTRRLLSGMAHSAVLSLENARLVDDLRNSSALKTEFIGTMSHELRSPLHAIIGCMDMLADEAAADDPAAVEERRDMLVRVRKHSAELLEMIEATLDVGRLDTTRMPVAITTVPLDRLFEAVRAEIPDYWLKEPVALVWELANLPLAEVDAAKLKTIVRNLVHNALKFTEAGCVTIQASVSVDAAECPVEAGYVAGTCVISVSDTGIGITDEILPIVFHMYRQGDASFTRRHGGVGLGLYIVKRMVEALDGTITVESKPGKGSRFEVRLPVRLHMTAVALSA